MKKEKHKWYHFVWGKENRSETIIDNGKIHTANYWEVCKKCGEQIGEKIGATTFSFPPFFVDKTPAPKGQDR